MNNNEFITEIARRSDLSTHEVADLMDGFMAEFTSHLLDEDVISIQGFGSFSVRKKMERVVMNPATKQRMLVPPKIVINFKVSPVLKEKLKA